MATLEEETQWLEERQTRYGPPARDSFWAYVQTCRVHDTPTGDFVRDARRTRHFPILCRTWDELRCHLDCNGACPEAIKAAYQVWSYWKYGRKRLKRSTPPQP